MSWRSRWQARALNLTSRNLGRNLHLFDYSAAFGLALVCAQVQEARQGRELDVEGGGELGERKRRQGSTTFRKAPDTATAVAEGSMPC
jgi:hypothetical protein